MLENYLKGKGVGEVVESKEKVKLSDEEYEQASSAVLSIIQQNVSSLILMDVINCTSAYHAWEKLKMRYNRVDEATQMKLDTELVNIRIKSKQSIEEFETIFMDKVGQYKMAGGIISDGQIKNRYIQALSDRYTDILKYASTSATKKFDGRGNSSLHRNQCRYCKEMGHWAKDCPVLAAKETIPKSSVYVSRLVGEMDDSSDTGDFINMLVNENTITNDVILDSAATSHMTGDATKLVNITPYHPPKFVRWCDGSKLKVLGFGDMELHLSVNGKLFKARFGNTQLVENMKITLISEVVLDQKGYTCSGGNGKRRFYKDNQLRIEANIANGLYSVDLFDYTSVQFAHNNLMLMNTVDDMDSALFHKRFIDIAQTKLQHMINHCIVSGNEKIKN